MKLEESSESIGLVIFTLISITNINSYACLNLSSNNRNVVNAAVTFFRMDDPFTMKTADSLENIAKDDKNNIKFTFFDPKNNISVQPYPYNVYTGKPNNQ